MNEILQLKGTFESAKNKGTVGAPSLPKGQKVEVHHIRSLISQLVEIKNYWHDHPDIKGALVSVHYDRVVAKSHRIKCLLKEAGKTTNVSIRGSKFEHHNGNICHVFTHFINLDALYNTINMLQEIENIMVYYFNGTITNIELKKINKKGIPDTKYSKSTLSKAIVDCFYVSYFAIDKDLNESPKDSIVTVYKTGVDSVELLQSIGINLGKMKMLNETTFHLKKEDLDILKQSMPYLIAMSVSDISEWNKEDILDNHYDEEIITIPDPTNEPTIGVIDTQFDDQVYFSKWVDSKNLVNSNIEIRPKDKEHGTAVCSIIVDGPTINPNLDDGCGRFKVRHFGVAVEGKFSSISVLKNIEKIVKKNLDIKVWNLSLGALLEIEENFVSPEGALLDRLQNEYDIVFVVAGTNKGSSTKENMKIGAPADSINSIVVNSVDFSNQPASYGRCGPVLSFFHKPDVSYYGGDVDKAIDVCEPLGKWGRIGTSYAAPWISRKMAYLIHKMGFSREVAKALLIDSAAGWNRRDDHTFRVGFGVVPRKIEDILKTNEDEIKFILSGTVNNYETFTYNIPVPRDEKGFPYIARATLAYYPKCDRNQGVDYTCSEMDIHFGRVKEKDGKVSIKAINNNSQGDENGEKLFETNARKMYRKWDNVKHISEKLTSNARSKKIYGAGNWGLMIRKKERLDDNVGLGMKFGVVVTLKEINGLNRIQDFINLCRVHGWLVNKVDVELNNTIYDMAEEEIEWD